MNFAGKSDSISDITGEKLHEIHVLKVMNKILCEMGIVSSFYFLAPEINDLEIYYVLFIQTDRKINTTKLQQSLEAGLCENYHYKHSRELGQLSKPEIFFLNNQSLDKFYSIIQTDRNLSSFKQSVLRKETSWKSKLKASGV